MSNCGIIILAAQGFFLNWQPPTENVDGTPLDDLAGYRVYTVQSGAYTQVKDITTPLPTYLSVEITEGNIGETREVVMTAYDTDSNESSYSNMVVKTIVDITPPSEGVILDVRQSNASQ